MCVCFWSFWGLFCLLSPFFFFLCCVLLLLLLLLYCDHKNWIWIQSNLEQWNQRKYESLCEFWRIAWTEVMEREECGWTLFSLLQMVVLKCWFVLFCLFLWCVWESGKMRQIHKKGESLGRRRKVSTHISSSIEQPTHSLNPHYSNLS